LPEQTAQLLVLPCYKVIWWITSNCHGIAMQDITQFLEQPLVDVDVAERKRGCQGSRVEMSQRLTSSGQLAFACLQVLQPGNWTDLINPALAFPSVDVQHDRPSFV
jgi:hypothetical protein